jgi:hypothetical protein
MLDTFDSYSEQIWMLVCVGQHGVIQVCEHWSVNQR